MIPMIFIGIIMYYLGILQGKLMIWYIIGLIVEAIKIFKKVYDECF